jgi:GxxExxY protein
MELSELSGKIIGNAIEVHKVLGPGLLESAYEQCLMYELKRLNLKVEQQKSLPIIYKTIKLDCGYRMDLVVEDKIIIELKSVEKILPIHKAQVLSYLKLAKYKLGLLINFNVNYLKDGIVRLVNEL